MKAKTIEGAVHKSPFRPFFLQVVNGTRVKVEHPECIVFNGRKTECIVAEGRDDFHFLELAHISGISYLANGKSRGKHQRSGK